MKQGYTQENSRDKSKCSTRVDFIPSVTSRRTFEAQTFIIFCLYTCEVSHDQWSPYILEKTKLSGVETISRETREGYAECH